MHALATFYLSAYYAHDQRLKIEADSSEHISTDDQLSFVLRPPQLSCKCRFQTLK